MSKVVDAEHSDVFDVLAYTAFALAPITRAARVAEHRADILHGYDPKLQAFIDLVLGQYVSQGVEELDKGKLIHLLELKYRTLHDAFAELGRPADDPGRVCRVPARIVFGGLNGDLPSPDYVEAVRDALPGRPDYHVVAGADHLASP